MKKVQGVLVDFDGVLVDTDKSTIDFYNRYLKEKGLYIPYSYLDKKIGKKSIDFLKEVIGSEMSEKELWKLIEKKRKEFLKNFEEYVRPIEDGIEMVEKFYEYGYDMCVVSGNSKDMIRKGLKKLKIDKYIKDVVAWEDVEKKKPDPESYFKGCEKLGLDKECLIVEDSPLGLEGALKTGMMVATKKLKYNMEYWLKVDILVEKYSDLPEVILRYF